MMTKEGFYQNCKFNDTLGWSSFAKGWPYKPMYDT